MKCNVTVSGPNKARFEKLKAKFGQVPALQAIYDGDGVASIEGYTSDMEIAQRVNAIAFFAMNELSQMAGGLPSLNQLDSNTSKSRVDKALDSAYKYVEKIVENAINEYESGDKPEGAYIAQRAYVVLETFDLLEQKVKDKMVNYGLKLSNIENDLSQVRKEEEGEETNKEYIYDKGSTETSRLDSVPPQIKLYVSTLAKSAYQEKGNRLSIEPVLDDIGMKQPVDFNEAYSMLSKSLTNINTIEGMMEKMYEMGEEIPYMQDIYEDLDNNLMESDVKIKLKGNDVKNFKSSFFASFRNNFNKAITVNFRNKEEVDGTTGETVKSIFAQLLDTNKRRLHNEIKKNWMQEHTSFNRLSKLEREEIWNRVDNEGDSMAKFFDTKNMKSNIRRLNTPSNKAVLYELSKHLKSTGINVSVEALSQLRKKLNRGGMKNAKFGDKVMSDQGSYKNILERFWLMTKAEDQGQNVLGSENTSITELARAEAAVSNDRSGGVYMNGEDNMVYPINLPTGASDLFDDFRNKAERLDEFAKDPLMGNLRIIKKLKESKGETKMDMATFDTVYNGDRSQGTPFGDLDPLSSMATRLSLHMNFSGKGMANASTGWYMTPTPADRSGTRIFKMPKLTGIKWEPFTLGVGKSDLTAWLQDTVVSEFNRVKTVRAEYDRAVEQKDKSKLIDNYHLGKGDVLGNGGYFNYYPELNSLLNEVGVENFDPTSTEVMDIVRDATIAQVEADIDHLENIGLIENVGKNYKKFNLTELAAKLLPPGTASANNIVSFVVNNIIANHELSTIFNGDLAFFKATDYTSGEVNQKPQLSNANKRAGLADTPGTKLYIGEGGAQPTFEAAFVRDAEDVSPYLNQYIEAIGKAQGQKYSKMETTDGQGLVSLDRYADILAGLGELTPSMTQTINELRKDNPDWAKVTEVIQPIKGFLHGQRFDSTYDRVMPKNLKYSIFPMIPSNFKDNSVMKGLSDKMVRDGVGELVFTTGSKLGAYNVGTLSDESFNTVTLSNEDWRLPQVVPYKTKTSENFGTQIRKLIVGNVNKAADYGKKKGTQLMQDYQSAIALNMKQSISDLYAGLSEGGKPSTRKIAEKVKNDIARNAYKTTPDFMEQALEIVEQPDGTFDTRIPMSFPALKHRVEGSLNSAVRKAVTKQDLPGIAAVQYTGLGYNKSLIKTDKELKFVRMEDGKVKPAEIKVSPQYFIQSLLKKEQTPAIKSAIQRLKTGDFNISDFSDDLLEGVIYRIPTQGKNSTLPIKIAAFTPEAQGSAITIPPEITVQSGSDYDIDKVYLEMKHFDVNAETGKMVTVEEGLGTKEERDNTIVNTHYNILTSPEHFKELITPNNSDTLDGISREMEKTFSANEAGRKWSSLATQDDFRDKNQAGGVMIGVFSIANTAHSLFQELGVSLRSRSDARSTTDVKGESPINVYYGSGENSELSNLAKRSFKFEDFEGVERDFQSVEHAYQTLKNGNFNEEVYGRPKDFVGTKKGAPKLTAKGKRGSVAMMKMLIKESFTQNGDAKQALKGTGSSPITHNQDRGVWRETFPEILMEVRSELFGTTTASKGITTFTQSQGVTINGVEVDSLSQTYSRNGKGEVTKNYISDDHMENQTAAVDNASNPVLGNLNINTTTASVYNFLIEAGSGIPFAAKLVGSPIIRELTASVRKYEAIQGKDSAFQKALNELADSRNINIESVNSQDFDVELPVLEAALDSFGRGENTPDLDQDILLAFLTFRKYGNDLVQVQQALQTDNVGAHQTLAANYIHVEQLAKVKGTRSNAIKTQQYPSDVLETVPTIELDRELYKNHSMESFEAFGLHGAISLVGSVIDDTKPVQQKVIKDFSKSVNRLNDRDLRLLMNDFYSYVYLNQNTGLSDTSAVADYLDSETMTELLVGEDSVGKRVLELQNEETSKANDDVTYIPNEFIMSLTVDLNSDKNGYDLVKFNNTISRALSSEQKSTLSNEFVRLFTSNPELAQDLTFYSLGMDGFNRHTESFGDFIHVSVYENMFDSEGNNSVDYYRNIRSDFENINEFSFEDFRDKFFLNRAADLKGVLDLSRRKRDEIRTYLKENPRVEYFKAQKQGKLTIARSRQDETGNFDFIGDPLGVPNTQVEYQTGLPMAQMKDVQDAIAYKELSQDVDTTC